MAVKERSSKSRGIEELETENTQRNLNREKSQDKNRKKSPKNMLTDRNMNINKRSSRCKLRIINSVNEEQYVRVNNWYKE